MMYAFEDIGADLPRPPLAARRALLCAGVALPLETWQSLPIEVRQRIVQEGTHEKVDEATVKNAVSPVLKRVRFMGKVKDPPLEEVPVAVADALRSFRPVSAEEWRRLRPLDRYTLVALAANSRLLWRAVEEMAGGQGTALSSVKLQPWVGQLASCKVHMSAGALGELSAGLLMSGKAMVLARTSGVRLARRAHEIIDGYAEKYAGPVELDSRIDFSEGTCVWQGHVSTVDGEFFSPASLLAVAAAAVAVRDAVATRDPKATITDVAIREEAWSVGSSAFGEEATVNIDAKAYLAARGIVPEVPQPAPVSLGAPPPSSSTPGLVAAPAPRSGVPVWVVVLLLITTLAALGAAVAVLIMHHPLR